MSLLDQMWDDTVAGPRPDTGLGKLRKQSTFGFRSNASGKELTPGGENASGGGVKVTRSIMIMKPPTSTETGTPPASPAGSTPPISPLSGGSSGGFRFRRRSTSDAYDKTSGVGSRSPPRPPYDI